MNDYLKHCAEMRAKAEAQPWAVVPVPQMRELLEGINRGDFPIIAARESFEDVYAGDVEFVVTGGEFEGWRIVWFNDCDSFDYIDRIVAPDGRMTNYDDMYRIDEEIDPTYPRSCFFDNFEPNEAVWRAAPAAKQKAEPSD